MATSIAVICVEKGYEDHEALGTALLTLALSTLLVGVLIMLVGRFESCPPLGSEYLCFYLPLFSVPVAMVFA